MACLDSDNQAYFDAHGLDPNEWVRTHIRVDEVLRAHLASQDQTPADDAPDQVAAKVEEVVTRVVEERLLVLTNEWADHQGQSEEAVKASLSAQVQGLLRHIELLMKSTTSDAVNSRLIELSDKVNSTTQAILAETGAVKDQTGQLLSHHLRYDNAKSNGERGNIAQDEFFDAMDSHFNTAEIIRTHEQPGSHSADFEIRQEGREPVIIDVKRAKKKIPQDHVSRFYDDVAHSRKHGALVSLTSGITRHQHLQIEVVENRYVVIFVCDCGNDMRTLETALNIIDWVSGCLKRFTAEDDVVRLDPQAVSSMVGQLKGHIERVRALQDTIHQCAQLCKDLLSAPEKVTQTLTHAAPPSQAEQPKTAPKPFHCDICDAGYASSSNYNDHLKRKRANSPTGRHKGLQATTAKEALH